MGKLNAKQRQALPDEIFGIPEDRSFPMPDAKHVKSAISFFHKAPENKKKELAKNIARRVKELNIKVVGNCQYMRYLSPTKESSIGFNGLYGYNRIDESSTKIISMPNVKKNNGYIIKGGMVASLPKKNIDMNASNIGTLSPIVPLNQEPPLQQGPSIHEDYLDGELDDSMFVSDSKFADNVEDIIATLKQGIYIEEKTKESSINYDDDNKKDFTLEDYQRDLYSQICISKPDDEIINELSNEKLDRKIDYIMKTRELKDIYNYMTKPCKKGLGTYTNDYSTFGIYLRQTIIDILDSGMSDEEIVMRIIRLLPCSLKKDDLFWNLYPVKMKRPDLFKKIITGYMDKLIGVKNSNGTKLQDLIGSISEFNNFIYKDKPLAVYINLENIAKNNKKEKIKGRNSRSPFIGLASHNFPEYLLGKNERFKDMVATLAFQITFSAIIAIEDALKDNYYVKFASPIYRAEDLDDDWKYGNHSGIPNHYDYDSMDFVFHDVNSFRNVVNELYMDKNYFINYPTFDESIPFTFYTVSNCGLHLHFFYMLRDRNNKSNIKICEYICKIADVTNENGRWKIQNIPIRYIKYPITSDSASFVTFQDQALKKETIDDIVIDSFKFYHDCDISNPQSVKDAIMTMANHVPDISDHYFKLIPHYNNIMTMDYLSTESTKIVKEASVKKFMNRLKDTITGIEISDKGDIKIDLRDKLSFKNYEEIHSVLKENQKSHNYEAMKENIAYIFALINTLDSLYVDAGKGRHKKEIKKDDEYYEMMRLRALFISDFKTYLRIIQKHDPKFNFLEYYKSSPANSNTVTIKGTTIKKLGMLFKSIIL